MTNRKPQVGDEALVTYRGLVDARLVARQHHGWVVDALSGAVADRAHLMAEVIRLTEDFNELQAQLKWRSQIFE